MSAKGAKRRTTRKKAAPKSKVAKKKSAKKATQKKAAKKKATKKKATKKTAAKPKKKPTKKKAAKKTATKKTAKKKKATKKKATKKKTAKKTATKKAATKKKAAKKTATKKAAKKTAATRGKKTVKKKPASRTKGTKTATKSVKGVATKTRRTAMKKVARTTAKARAKSRAIADKAVAQMPVDAKEEVVKEQGGIAEGRKKKVLRVARGERRPTRRERPEDPVEKARAALAKVGQAPHGPGEKNGEMKRGAVVEINPRLESSREKIETKPSLPNKPMSVAQRKRAEAEAAFAKIAPSHGQPESPHFHKSRFDVRISERDSLATQVRLSRSDTEALHAARELADRFQLPPDQTVLLKIVSLGDAALTKLALEELLELDDKGRVRATTDLIETVSAITSKDSETVELKDLLLEKVGAR